MTATYNTGNKNLVFVEVPEAKRYHMSFHRPTKQWTIYHSDNGRKWSYFSEDNLHGLILDGTQNDYYKIIGLFKDLTENDLIKLIRFDYTQSGIKIMHDIIKSQGLDPEKTLIIEKI